MPRRKTHNPLNVLINNRLVGRLEKQADGAISFQYDATWLEWEHPFAVSLSLPLRKAAYRGAAVVAVFDNLLPDNANVRRRVAERTGAEGTDVYSLLEQIGRDCVGAMQFLPDGADADATPVIQGEPIADDEIERLLADLKGAPLGIDPDHEFRISVAGVQEKTALLRHNGRWMRPIGTTPTTHILKPEIGEIPTASGVIDMAKSVDNEHYCLRLMEAFGLPVASTKIATFGKRRVLVVERFDREWIDESRIIRLPQEDCCQALGKPSSQKYQNEGGPGAVDILKLLQASDDPRVDQSAFLASQILFWLLGATDGHGKNFSIFLRSGGTFSLTPFYDVLSVQTAVDRKQLQENKFRLAMSAGQNRHYRMSEILGRHFVQTGKAGGLGSTIIREVISNIIEKVEEAPSQALAEMPDDFAEEIHESIALAISTRLMPLETAFGEL